MNYSDITVGIVTFKSEKVLFDCLKSIRNIKKIIIFDNSNDITTKKKVNKIYPKIKFILSKKNLGYGKANNRIIKLCKTKYIFILNPDTILKKNCEYKLLKSIRAKKSNFAIVAPLSKEKNFGFFKKNLPILNYNLFEVDYVKGFAMLMNVSKIKKVGMFDKNFFLYLEEIDLCKRLKLNKEKILICKDAEVIHLAAKSSNLGFEFEKCRNWHWMWSSFYFDKKYSNYINSFLKFLPILIINIIKLIFYFLLFNKHKSKVYFYRSSGIFNAILRKDSWYRPDLGNLN
tara:strand:+ start:1016 stop:1876 length:861 start_codon:yes stop_codon:yes gene_type:complete